MARGEIHLDEAFKTPITGKLKAGKSKIEIPGSKPSREKISKQVIAKDKSSACRQGVSRQAKGPASSVPGKSCRGKAFELRIRRPEDQKAEGSRRPGKILAGKASLPARPGPSKFRARQGRTPRQDRRPARFHYLQHSAAAPAQRQPVV